MMHGPINIRCILSVCYEILPNICTNSKILLKVGVADKGKMFTLEQAMKNRGGGNRAIAILLLSPQCYMRLGGYCYASAAIPLGLTQYLLYGRHNGPQGQSRQVQKILPPPGFNPQTVQPVASHCTN